MLITKPLHQRFREFYQFTQKYQITTLKPILMDHLTIVNTRLQTQVKLNINHSITKTTIHYSIVKYHF
jgi:hypothetical protein